VLLCIAYLIKDILHSANDEIRLIITGSIGWDETYIYQIPVPQLVRGHPCFAKATLTYFSESSCYRAAEYPGGEMDICFGRAVNSVECGRQAQKVMAGNGEDGRRMYRRWGNVCHISENIRESAGLQKAYGPGLLGLCIRAKQWLQPRSGYRLRFGVVVTLKERKGINRIDEFAKLCMARGWGINRLDVHNRCEIYNKGEEEIAFD